MDYVILIEFIVVFLLFIVSIKKIPKDYFLKQSFVEVSLITSIWLAVNFIFKHFNSFVAFKWAYGTGAIMLASAVIVVISFSAQKKMIAKQKFFLYLSAVLIASLCLYRDVFFVLRPNFEIIYTNAFLAYVAYMLIAMIFMHYKLISSFKKLKGIVKMQGLYIFLGILTFTILAFLTSFIFPLLQTYFISKPILLNITMLATDTFGSLFFVGFTFYAIAAHNLMDIDLAWRKALREICYYFFIILYIGFIVYFLETVKLNIPKEIIFSVIMGVLLIKIHTKLKFRLHNLFLGKYQRVWDAIKRTGNIKSDTYEKEEISRILVYDVSDALNIPLAGYYSLDKINQTYNLEETTFDGFPSNIMFSNKIIFELLQTKTYIYSHNLKDTDLVSLFEAMNIEICLPLFYRDTLLGLVVYGKKKNEGIFNTEDLELLAETIRCAEEQVDNVMKVQNIAETTLMQYKNVEQEMLFSEAKRLSKIKNIQELCEHTKKIVNRLLNVKNVRIYLTKSGDNKIYREMAMNDEDKTIEINEENYLIKYLIERNEIISITRLDNLAKESTLFSEAYQTAKSIDARYIIPLTDEKLLGFLIINDREDSIEYREDDFRFFAFIRNVLEMTISNIFASELANIDGLTGLYNKRYLNFRLEQEVIRSFRECLPVSYLMIDGDNFKSFNDKHGHDVGDKVLIAISGCIQQLIRPTDEVFRYGGEEFAVLCPGTNNEGAFLLAKRINQDLKKNVEIENLSKKCSQPITVSIGVGTYKRLKNKTNYTNQEILNYCLHLQKKADNSLYEAKRLGKDQVVNDGFFEILE